MSFPGYENHKESGVEWLGEVPAHWGLMPLKRDLNLLTSGSLGWAEHYAEEGNLFLRIGNLTRDRTALDLSDIQRVLIPDGLEGERTRVQPGDLLFSITAYLGSVAVVPPGIEAAYVSQHVALARLRQQSLLPEWVGLVTLSSIGKAYLETQGYGGTKIQLSLDDVANLLMTVPPIEEQRSIVAFVEYEAAKINALIEEQQRLIALLKEKRQAVISHAVTKGLDPNAPMKDSGVEWIGDMPAHWRRSKIKFIKSPESNSFVDGPFGGNLKSEHFIDNGDVYVIESAFATQGSLNVVEVKTISAEHFYTIQRSEVRENDIVIAKIGAQFGKSCILPYIDKRAVISGNTLKLTVDDTVCATQFVWLQIVNLKQIGAIDEIVNGTAQPALSLGEMNNLPILVPPIAEQLVIVRYLSEKLGGFDALIAAAEFAVALLQERRSALISAAVTGKIDVRGLVPDRAEAA